MSRPIPTALVILGIRDQDSFPLIFYRQNGADMALSSDDIDDALIALRSGHGRASVEQPHQGGRDEGPASGAQARGPRMALDIDYRPNLWGMARAKAGS